MKTKYCGTCDKNKDINAFRKRKDRHTNDGRESVCAECKRNNKKRWYSLNKYKPQTRYRGFISNSRLESKPCDITLETYVKIISQPCFYCNCSIAKEVGCGLDRLDHNVGYTETNVVPCCSPCNTGRNVFFTPEEWKIGITAILEYRKLKS